MGTRIHVFLGELLAEVDEARGDLSRSAYVRRALEAQVELDKRVREVLQEAVEGAGP